MKKIILLLFVSFSLLLACKKEPTEFEKFNHLFNELTTDTIKTVFITDKDEGDTLITGRTIPSAFFHLFEIPREFVEYQTDSSCKGLATAYGKIKIGDQTGYMIRFYNKEIRVPNFICLYLYDKSTGKLRKPETLQYDYGSEGSEWFTDSWIYDLNKDGNKDLIQQIYECNLSGENAEISHFVDTLTVGIWTDTTFKETYPKNYKQLKKQFKGDCICGCGEKE